MLIMELNLDEFRKSKKGDIFFVKGRERDIDIFAERTDKVPNEMNVKIIRGIRSKTRESLIQEFAASLQFSYYAVNDNWNGFEECINDLDVHSGNKYLLFITNFNEVLSSQPRDLKIFLAIIKEAIENLAKETRNNIPNQTPIILNIVFHCIPEKWEECNDLLKENGIKSSVRILKPFDNVA